MLLQRLILLRHGTAENRSASGRDFDRALTSLGRSEAFQAGRRLAELGLRPDLALVSAATRARQTWDEAAALLAAPRLQESRDLYNASAEALIAAAEASGAGTVVVVAHNPGLHALAVALAEGGAFAARMQAAFPPATAAVFRFEDGVAICEAMIIPGEGG